MPGRDLLEGFLRDARADPARTLIALDVDGTVSDVAPAPDEAFVSDALRATLARVAEQYRLWFVSGRDAAVARELVGVDGAGYVGAHGLEAFDGGALRALAPLEDLGPQLEALASGVAAEVPEIAPYVERKRWSIGFHYRAVPEAGERLRAVIEARLTPALRLYAGKMLLEALPAVDHDKGTALAWVIDTHAPQRALVAGDDMTDLPMFRLVAERRARGAIDGVAVAVIQPGETPADVLDAADSAVDGVAGLHRLLLELLAPA
jgi:trehalose-phosphatase